MNRALKIRIGSVVVVGLLTTTTAAVAGPTSEWRYIGEFQPSVSTAGLSTPAFQNGAGLGTNFDSSAWDGASTASTASASALTLDSQTAAATQASMPSSSDRMRVLSASSSVSNTSPVVGSPAALSLTLLNFIASVKAQQVGNPFVQLQTTAANIDYTLNGVPAPVPLPPASWLFGCGVAAMFAGRFLVRGTRGGNVMRALATA